MAEKGDARKNISPISRMKRDAKHEPRNAHVPFVPPTTPRSAGTVDDSNAHAFTLLTVMEYIWQSIFHYIRWIRKSQEFFQGEEEGVF